MTQHGSAVTSAVTIRTTTQQNQKIDIWGLLVHLHEKHECLYVFATLNVSVTFLKCIVNLSPGLCVSEGTHRIRAE